MLLPVQLGRLVPCRGCLLLMLASPLVATGCGDMGLQLTALSIEGARVSVFPEGELEFGCAVPDGEVLKKQLTVEASGDESLLLENVWLEDEQNFLLIYDPSPTSLEPGESVIIQVGFLPPASGQFNDILMMDLELDQSFLLSRRLLGSGCQSGTDYDLWDPEAGQLDTGDL